MNELINDIKSYLDKYKSTICCANDYELEKSANAKINGIINANSANYDGDDYNKIVKRIYKYLDSGDIAKKKLQNFSLDFVDPVISKQDSQTVINQKFLSDDELYKLYGFIKAHENDATFGDAVYEIMDKRNWTAPQVYKQAKLSRQDFSRITSDNMKGVKKSTVWNVIIGLHCTLDEADYLLFSAGYVRRQTVFDLTLEYFLINKNFDILAINVVLDELGQKPLACFIPVNDNDSF